MKMAFHKISKISLLIALLFLVGGCASIRKSNHLRDKGLDYLEAREAPTLDVSGMVHSAPRSYRFAIPTISSSPGCLQSPVA